MGVRAHKGPTTQPVCCGVSMRACVLIFTGRMCAAVAKYSLQCTGCETKGVCESVAAIVSELIAEAGFFPPVQCFVGGVLAAQQQQRATASRPKCK